MKLVNLFILCLMVSLNNFAQDSISFKKNRLEIYPVSVTLNRGTSIGHSILYNHSFTPSIFAELCVDGVLFRALDAKNKRFTSQEKFPLFNHSKIIFGYQFKKKDFTQINQSTNNFGVRLGYQYMQFGSQNGDYWQVDTSAIGEKVIISGFKNYSLVIGAQYIFEKYKKKNNNTISRISHQVFIDYLMGMTFLLEGNLVQGNQASTTNITNNFPSNHSGINIGYSFSHSLAKKLSFNAGLSFTWSPFIDYTPNSLYYIERGGTTLDQLFSNVKIGLGF